MEFYCIKCRGKKMIPMESCTKTTAANGRPMMRSKCTVCSTNICKFTVGPAKKPTVGKKKKVKPEIDQEGDGIFDIFWNAWGMLKGYRLDFSPSIRKLLESIGSKKIVKMKVVRAPLQTVLKKILSILTGGKSDQVQKDLNYDDLYHLALYIELDDGATYRYEKDEIPKLTRVESSGTNEVIQVPLPAGGIVLSDFMGKTIEKMGKNKFFVYTVNQDNCQAFVLGHLSANGLLNPGMREFIMQNAAALLGDSSLIKYAKGATDLAHFWSLLVEGRGMMGSGIWDWIESLFKGKKSNDNKLFKSQNYYESVVKSNKRNDDVGSLIYKILTGGK